MRVRQPRVLGGLTTSLIGIQTGSSSFCKSWDASMTLKVGKPVLSGPSLPEICNNEDGSALKQPEACESSRLQVLGLPVTTDLKKRAWAAFPIW